MWEDFDMTARFIWKGRRPAGGLPRGCEGIWGGKWRKWENGDEGEAALLHC